MIHDVPGGATIELGEMAIEKRHLPGVQILVGIAVRYGPDLAVNLLASWLYSKLSGAKIKNIRINRAEVEVSPEGIARAIFEAVEIEKN
jgi:hypothetical protein